MTPTRTKLEATILAAVDKVLQEETQIAKSSNPQPGDLYLFGVRSLIGAQWLVIDSIASANGMVRVVATDSNPHAGTTDVSIPASARCGARTVRCSISILIERSAFSPEGWGGRVDDCYLAEVVKSLRDVPKGRCNRNNAELRTWYKMLRREARYLCDALELRGYAASKKIPAAYLAESFYFAESFVRSPAWGALMMHADAQSLTQSMCQLRPSCKNEQSTIAIDENLQVGNPRFLLRGDAESPREIERWKLLLERDADTRL